MKAAREATLKAIKEAEAGWQKAIAKIAKRAGLIKGPDGAWRDPSMSEAGYSVGRRGDELPLHGGHPPTALQPVEDGTTNAAHAAPMHQPASKSVG